MGGLFAFGNRILLIVLISLSPVDLSVFVFQTVLHVRVIIAACQCEPVHMSRIWIVQSMRGTPFWFC